MLECCSRSALLGTLESLRIGLNTCEKTLDEFVESKRREFARFYFVAPSHLLDILSKAHNPHGVLCHLSKLFDNVNNLQFEPDPTDASKRTKAAVAIVSKENERVELNNPSMECVGMSEMWLKRLVVVIQTNLRAYLIEAVQVRF